MVLCFIAARAAKVRAGCKWPGLSAIDPALYRSDRPIVLVVARYGED